MFILFLIVLGALVLLLVVGMLAVFVLSLCWAVAKAIVEGVRK